MVAKTLRISAAIAVLTPIAAAAAVAALPRVAHADEPTPMSYTCASSYTSQVVVDGIQADWSAEAGPTDRVIQLVDGSEAYDWTGGNDASFKLWCRVGDDHLYFAVIGRDDNIAHGDRFELWIEADDVARSHSQRLLRAEIDMSAAFSDEASSIEVGGVPLPDSRVWVVDRDEGRYFIEAAVPLSAFSGLIGFGPVGFAAIHRDEDPDNRGQRDSAVGTAPAQLDDPQSLGQLHFERFERRLAAIRTQLRVAEGSDASRSAWMDVAGDGRREYVAVLGDELVVTGTGMEGFNWVSMPVRHRDSHEALSIEGHDIDMDGYNEIFYRYAVERQDPTTDRSMRQEFVAVYDIDGTAITRVLHQEVANQVGSARLESTMELRNRGHRVIVRFGRPQPGDLTEDDWFDVDAGRQHDYEEMLLPWQSRSRISWFLEPEGWQVRDEGR